MRGGAYMYLTKGPAYLYVLFGFGARTPTGMADLTVSHVYALDSGPKCPPPPFLTPHTNKRVSICSEYEQLSDTLIPEEF